jgi:5-methylcytosine-specific restriction endonuclease McrA
MSDKKKIRTKFREAVFARDKNKCHICGRTDVKLDAHHIVPRDLLRDGGYSN